VNDERSQAVKRSWEGRAKSWEHQVGTSPAFTKIRDAVIDKAAPSLKDKAADLGCGGGFLTFAVAELAGEVVAVDLAASMIQVLREEVARRKMSNIKTMVENLAEVDFPAQSLDLVVSSYALHHLTNEDKKSLVARTSAWLRPGGRIVIADMMFGRGGSPQDRRIIRGKMVQLLRKGPVGVWRIFKNLVRLGLRRGIDLPVPPQFWVSALQEAGFQEVEYKPIIAEAGLVSGKTPE